MNPGTSRRAVRLRPGARFRNARTRVKRTRRTGLLGDERGTVTAEFAIVLPAVLLVLGLVIGGLLLAAHRITLTSTAADLARLEARGDTALAAARLSELGHTVEVQRAGRGALHCVTLRAQPTRGLLSAVTVTASGCAARSIDEQVGL